MDMNTIKSAVLQMIKTSGFAEAAGLAPADIAFRLSENPSFGPAAFSLDMSDCLEHAAVLQDHVILYGPTVLHSAFVTKLEVAGDKTMLSIGVRPEGVETASDDEEDDDFETIDDDEEFEDDDEEGLEDGDDLAGEVAPAAAEARTGGALQVLTTPEMHKMAGRIYSTLAESSNMARYVTFLTELDSLLGRYGGLPAAPRVGVDVPLPEEASTDDMSTGVVLRPDGTFMLSANKLTLASGSATNEQAMQMFIGGLAAIDVNLGEVAASYLEEAKGKKKGGHKEGRSGLLSAIMKALSGDDRLQSSWDKIAVDDFKSALNSVADKVVEKLASFDKKGEKEETASFKAVSSLLPNGETAALGTSDIPEGPSSVVAMLPVLNGAALIDWASEFNFDEMCAPSELHATVAYSKAEIDWNKVPEMDTPFTVPDNTERSIGFLGDSGALVLHLSADDATELKKRWQQYKDAGASWDYPDYMPHITLSYKSGLTEEQLVNVRPYEGELMFGPEVRKQLSDKGDFDVNKIEHVPVN